MENEFFKIFDEERNIIGVASRKDVHELGYWHETFHCWFVTNIEGKDYIYLQLRSDTKQDYPNLLDITVAGHLMADETAREGVREIKEEVGIDIPFHDLVPLGLIKYCVINENLIDKELAHLFLYKSAHNLNDFTIQPEEVSGMVLVEFNDFSKLWLDEKQEIKVSGFKIDKENNRADFVEYIGKNQFVPHQISYYIEVINKIKDQI